MPTAAGRCVHKRLAYRTPLVYLRPMPAACMARTALSLLVAYAIVLGGVLAPALGHGFDPSLELCAPASADGRSPDGQRPNGAHDCCPALCGSQPAVVVPAATIGAAVFHASAIETPRTPQVRKSGALYTPSARAPPEV